MTTGASGHGRSAKTCAAKAGLRAARKSPLAAARAARVRDLAAAARAGRVRILAAAAVSVAGAVVIGVGFAAGAQDGPGSDPAGSDRLRALFPQEAPITAPAGRLARLVLPPEVVAACRSDLSDLRIFDASGREVPYLVDAGRRGLRDGESGLEVTRTASLEIRGVDRARTDRESGPPLYRESYTLAVPADLPAGLLWDLEAVTSRPRFVKKVEVAVGGGEGGDEGAATGENLAGGSLFRLDAGRERTTVPLPAFTAAALTVSLEGEDGGYLEPAFRLVTGRTIAGRERAVVPLAEVARRREGGDEGRTEVELERPRGLVPDALRLTTTTPAFSRAVEVWDEGPGSGDAALGRRTPYRLRASTAVEDLDVPLASARGDRLRVVIVDGDSPPLDALAFAAVVRRPVLLFALPADPSEGEGATATLRFGGGRAFRPRYDLAALAGRARPPANGEAAEVAELLYDPALAAEAKLGPAGANPDFDPTPALAFAQHPGADLDVRLFRHRRPLTAHPSAEGLVRLPLTAEDLARARPDLADLRIVDAEGHQWAYLLDRDAAEDRRPLAVTGPESRDGTSRYRLAPDVRPATLVRVVLSTDAPYFDRAFTLTGTTPEDGPGGRGEREVQLARGRLVRRAGDPRPVLFAFPPTRLDRLELTVDDGDDAPLAFTGAEALLPVAEVYFAAPAGDYALLVGNPEADAPRYELARVRDVALAVAAGDATTAPLAENPDFSRGARLATAPGAQQVLLWVALGLAVLVLGGLTLRLAKRES